MNDVLPWIIAGVGMSWLILLVVKPSVFLHPVAAWHRLWLFHSQEVKPEGFADWDLHCSCGKVWEL